MPLHPLHISIERVCARVPFSATYTRTDRDQRMLINNTGYKTNKQTTSDASNKQNMAYEAPSPMDGKKRGSTVACTSQQQFNHS